MRTLRIGHALDWAYQISILYLLFQKNALAIPTAYVVLY